MDKSIITVNIFGSEYTIKGVAEPDYIIQLANYLNTKMQEVQDATGLKDAKKIAILAAINISDELFEARKSMKDEYVSNEQLGAVRNRVEELIALIDRELPSSQESPEENSGEPQPPADKPADSPPDDEEQDKK